MAIKLLDVTGPKLLDGQESASTQDFVLVDHSTFFVRNLTDYVPFSQLLLNHRHEPQWLFKLRLFWFYLCRGQLRQLEILKAATGRRIANPLDVSYYSTTAYAFGTDRAVKFCVKPSQTCAEAAQAGQGEDYLRAALSQRVENQDVAFDFYLQLQQDPIEQPIEDPTVEWTTPWKHVAQLTIPKQDGICDADCERLAFNPWHSIAEHRPLGGINRARKYVYLSLSRLRRSLNGAAEGEP
jgi:catalase